MNVFEYEYEGRNKEGKSQINRFCWITDIKLAKRNLEEMILAGRGRWKIENEGFNNQKNGIYRIEHLNSRNSNAMKNHYLLTQIADILIFDYDRIASSKELTDELSSLLKTNEIPFKRGIHWTTDAGYRETWGQVVEHREKGALCVEMEGVGLFTIANYRNCAASAIYVVSDVFVEKDWDLGWGEKNLNEAVEKVLDMMISTATKEG